VQNSIIRRLACRPQQLEKSTAAADPKRKIPRKGLQQRDAPIIYRDEAKFCVLSKSILSIKLTRRIKHTSVFIKKLKYYASITTTLLNKVSSWNLQN
jgi:hypothetical protein